MTVEKRALQISYLSPFPCCRFQLEKLRFVVMLLFTEILPLPPNSSRGVQPFGVSGPHWKKKSYLGHTLHTQTLKKTDEQKQGFKSIYNFVLGCMWPVGGTRVGHPCDFPFARATLHWKLWLLNTLSLKGPTDLWGRWCPRRCHRTLQAPGCFRSEQLPQGCLCLTPVGGEGGRVFSKSRTRQVREPALHHTVFPCGMVGIFSKRI